MRRKSWEVSAEDYMATQRSDELAQAELRETLDEAIALLDYPLKSILRWRFFEHCSFAELAAKDERPISTMWKRYRRALAELRVILENRCPDLLSQEPQYGPGSTYDYRGRPLP
jgi:DNA-directed RNA polymerase specialized sigma24 family protein